MSESSLLPASLTKALAGLDVPAVNAAWQALPADRRPDAEALGDWLATPAAGKISPALAEWFVSQGAPLIRVTEVPRVGYKDWMSMAIGEANLDLLGWMLTRGGLNPNRHLPSGGPTPLQEAMDMEKWSVGEALLGWGADPNERLTQGQTSLHHAARNYKVEAMIWLVSHGADPALEDMYGHQPCERIPQDVGPEWRPDDVAQWLGEAVDLTEDERRVLPDAVRDEALLEKHGLEFVTKPQSEWSEDEARVAQVLVARELVDPSLLAGAPAPRTSRPRAR